MNVEKFINGLHEYLARTLRPFAERIKALEDRAPPDAELKEFCDELVKGLSVRDA